MDNLNKLGLLNTEIADMMKICPEISILTHDEIYYNIELLKKIDLQDCEIKDILIANPFILNRSYIDMHNLIIKLSSIGIEDIDSLIIINPFLLNKDAYEIDEYIHSNMERGFNIKMSIDALIDNPYILE